MLLLPLNVKMSAVTVHYEHSLFSFATRLLSHLRFFVKAVEGIAFCDSNVTR